LSHKEKDGGPDKQGMIEPAVTIITVVARQTMIMIRNINNPNYWSPQDGSFTVLSGSAPQSGAQAQAPTGNNISEFRKSWINRLLAPVVSFFF
jgi:hypothetical protein